MNLNELKFAFCDTQHATIYTTNKNRIDCATKSLAGFTSNPTLNDCDHHLDPNLVTSHCLRHTDHGGKNSFAFSNSLNVKTGVSKTDSCVYDRDLLSGTVRIETGVQAAIPSADSDILTIQPGKLCHVPPGLNRGILFTNSYDMVDFKHQIEAVVIERPIPASSAHDTVDGLAEKDIIQKDEIDDIVPNIEQSQLLRNLKRVNATRKTFARMIDTSSMVGDAFKNAVPTMAKTFGFQLDTFQQSAIMHLEKGESVFVAAHTSAGKTVIAEYAIALAQKHMTKTIYTSPIKALSNQKFRDFRTVFGDNEIGLVTGDVQIRPEAPCVIMTTEILRSMLYRASDLIRDIEFVIFDEVHYINDIERGVVWEEAIIMLPPHVTIILLSATIPNTFEFANWVGSIKQKMINVICTLKRPVPLEHHLFVSKVVPTTLYKICDSTKSTFDIQTYRKCWDTCNNLGAKSPKVIKSKDKNIWNKLLQHLQTKNLLPTVIFTFSKKRCEEDAEFISNLDFLDSKRKSEVHVFIERSLMRLKGSDRDLPQIRKLKQLLFRGIAVHHGGLLPIVKELVEILFSRNLVKVLFATETFAMGVNMPARSVVFNGIRKHDGSSHRILNPGEFTQMSGRAGRRGLDETGVVILAFHSDNDLPDATELQNMLLGPPSKLESKFKLTYNMILNILRIESLRVEDMMKRSFFESDIVMTTDEIKHKVSEYQHALNTLPPVECDICVNDIEKLSVVLDECLELSKRISDAYVSLKLLQPGRIVVTTQNSLACILRSIPGRKFQCVITRPNQVNVMPSPFLSEDLGSVLHPEDIILLTDKRLDISLGVESLLASLKSTSFVKEMDFKIKDFELNQTLTSRRNCFNDIAGCMSVKCPLLSTHLQMVKNQQNTLRKIQELTFRLSDQSLRMLPEYHRKMDLLKLLNFVDSNGIILLKGRVACEINSGNSLVLTTLIMENFFSDKSVAEVAALLSGFVFDEKIELAIGTTPSRMSNFMEQIIAVSSDIKSIQDEYVSVGDEENEMKLNFGLAVPVLEWSRGLSFSDVVSLTESSEGSVVRTIMRLNELCREIRDAARVIGNSELYQKMESVSLSIKRDIVFSASLYV